MHFMLCMHSHAHTSACSQVCMLKCACTFSSLKPRTCISILTQDRQMDKDVPGRERERERESERGRRERGRGRERGRERDVI
jgi:hypothetical protein